MSAYKVIPFVILDEKIDNISMTVILLFILVCLLVNSNSLIFHYMVKEPKALWIMILFYICLFLYFLMLCVCLFLIYYYWIFAGYTLNLSNYSIFSNLNQLESNVDSLVANNEISSLLSSTQQNIDVYKNYIVDSSVYPSLFNLNNQNQTVQSYYDIVNSTFNSNMQQLYDNLYNIIQSSYGLVNEYGNNLTVKDRLKYLFFDYASYYKNNILPISTNSNIFSNSIITDSSNRLVFNNLFMTYENDNFTVFNNQDQPVFFFNNNNNGSSFTISLSNAATVENISYTAAVSVQNNQLYMYISKSPIYSTGNFQALLSSTVNYTGLFISATANDISSVYFNSNIANTPNIPVNCFYDDLYNSIIYESIGIPLKFEFVNYNEYVPILVAYSGNEPQWIVQDETGVPICVINQVNGQFVAYFAISDSACVMVTFNGTFVSQSIIPNGLDANMWNVI